MTTRQYPKPREQRTLADAMAADINGEKVTVKPGMVGIISGDLSRYSIFHMCVIQMLAYSGELVPHFDWLTGSNITGNCNEICRKFMDKKDPQPDWLWLIGDDHAFLPDIVERLVLRQVDVVGPVCLQRSSPFPHVIYQGEQEDSPEEGTHVLHRDLPMEGLHQVYAIGGAGLLVKRHVLEAIGEPYFETFGKQNEDLEFCRKIRNAGFGIHVDCDALLGHIGQMIVWPYYNQDAEEWGIRLNVGAEQNVFLKRVMEALTPA